MSCVVSTTNSSYYLPGTIHENPVRCLLDTGCTLNILSERIFNRLPRYIRNRLRPSSIKGIMADGTPLPFLGEMAPTARAQSGWCFSRRTSTSSCSSRPSRSSRAMSSIS